MHLCIHAAGDLEVLIMLNIHNTLGAEYYAKILAELKESNQDYNLEQIEGLNIFNSTDFIGEFIAPPAISLLSSLFLYKFFPYIICSKHRSIIFLLFCIQTLTGSRASMLQVTFPVPVCCMIALNMETTTSSFSCGMNIVFNR